MDDDAARAPLPAALRSRRRCGRPAGDGVRLRYGALASLRVGQGRPVELDGDADLPAVDSVSDVMLATPLRYPGMPADRYWQLEEGASTSRRSRRSRTTSRGCAWPSSRSSAATTGCSCPSTACSGRVNQVETVRGHDDVRRDNRDRRGGRRPAPRGFRMFEVTTAAGETAAGHRAAAVAARRCSATPWKRSRSCATRPPTWPGPSSVVPGRSGDPRQRSAERRRHGPCPRDPTRTS